MKGDFTRSSDRPFKHYRGVRMQQGRLQLDSDWNEWVDIQDRLLRNSAADAVGKTGVPVDRPGFGVQASPDGEELVLSRGRIYVDGLLCESDADAVAVVGRSGDKLTLAHLSPDGRPLAVGQWIEVASGAAGSALHVTRISAVDTTSRTVTCGTAPPAAMRAGLTVRRLLTLASQGDLPWAASNPPAGDGVYLVYVDVWMRHVTALEDPALREVALGGPDTATRTQVLRQVKLLPLSGAAPDQGEAPLGEWTALLEAPSGALTARSEPGSADGDPNTPTAAGGYRRFGNQLYRVEIHTGGDEKSATFKWSRDNGAVADGLEAVSGDRLLLRSSTNIRARYADCRWVEISNEETTLLGQPGIVLPLAGIDGERLIVASWPQGRVLQLQDFGTNPIVRRWDGSGPAPLLATKDASGRPVNGGFNALADDGVEVSFSPGSYRPGDYWQIPARAGTEDIDWPRDAQGPIACRAEGVRHRYARLAVARRTGTNWQVLLDCRRWFAPLAGNAELYYVGGDGQEVLPGARCAHPLEIRAARGPLPVGGARVQFRVVAPSGGSAGESRVAATASAAGSAAVVAATDTAGIARCYWTPDPALTRQTVEATLLDESGQVTGSTIRFHGRVNVAAEVAYTPGDVPGAPNPATAQAALDDLRRNASLVYLGGDGQSAPLDEYLPQPVEVRVANGAWPVANARVRFSIVIGDGLVRDMPPPGIPSAGGADTPPGGGTVVGNQPPAGTAPGGGLGVGGSDPASPSSTGVARQGTLASPLEVRTDAGGMARCWWRPDNFNLYQRVEATYLGADGSPIGGVLAFSSSIQAAIGVSRRITQNLIGDPLTVGQAVYHDGTFYRPAIANSDGKTGLFVVGRIYAPPEAGKESFVIVQAGHIDWPVGAGPVLQSGQYYFVSDTTPGLLVANEPLGISNPILYADAPNGGYVLPFRPAESSHQTLKQYIDDLLVGSVSAFAMETPPVGWLECDGQAVSRVQYGRLFAKIGTTYGAGNGATTFNVPDLRGQFVRGWDHGRNLDRGRGFGGAQSDALQDHIHIDRGHAHGYLDIFFSEFYGSVTVPGSLGSHSTDEDNRGLQMDRTTNPSASSIQGVQSNYRTAAETRPTNVALMYCIRA